MVRHRSVIAMTAMACTVKELRTKQITHVEVMREMVRSKWKAYEGAFIAAERRSLSESVAWSAARAKPLFEDLFVLFLIAVAPRRRRPFLAGLAIPLALVAAFLMELPLSAICALIGCGWWFGANRSKWELVAVVGRGLVGTAWALIGINLLLAFPHDRMAAGFVWADIALALASVAVNARQADR
jgi:hypothetical protein